MFQKIKTALGAFNDVLFDRSTIFYDTDGRFTLGTQSPLSLIREGYKKNQNVFAVLSRLAQDGSGLPIEVVRRTSDGKEEVITLNEGNETGRDFFRFVHRPNDTQGLNYQSMMYANLIYDNLLGNTLNHGLKPIGRQRFTKRFLLYPQYVTVDTKQDSYGVVPTNYRYQAGSGAEFQSDEVLHIRRFDPDPTGVNNYMGMSPLQAAYQVLIASNEVNSADAAIIKNRGASGILTKRGERALKPEEKKMMDDTLAQRRQGSGKMGQLMSTSGDFKYIPFQMSPQDLQLIQSGKLKLRDFCNIYQVSSRIFNDPDGATYNNAKEDIKQYYLNGVLPPLQRQVTAFNELFSDSWTDGQSIYFIRVNTSGIDALQEDFNKKAEKEETENRVVRAVLEGVFNGHFDRDSAKEQIMKALTVDEEYALLLMGAEVPIGSEPTPTPQVNE